MIMSKEQFSKLISCATQAGEIEGIKGFLSRLILDLTDVIKMYEERRLDISENDMLSIEDWKDAKNNPPDTERKVVIAYENGSMELAIFCDFKWQITPSEHDSNPVVLWCEIPELPNKVNTDG